MARLFILLVKRINQVAGFIAGALMIYMAGHILLEIVLRFFDSSTFVLNEFVGYAVATMTFFGLGYSLERAGLIRVDMLTSRLPDGAAVLADLLVSTTCLVMFSWLSWSWLQNVERSFKRGISSGSLADTPIWIPEALVLIGLVIFCLSLLARVLSLALYRQPPRYVIDGHSGVE
ncbi:TRAP transporter small permease subunit [Oceanobacter mangrovi]|uniref:TRAP transporter small permease subunit n=1 Tax=Oceanobacter mangrovi TaxID=2862510 RepID=UPI001C8DB9B0|nr:TRAP transporter small permease [Oceanobacter mangrovi]